MARAPRKRVSPTPVPDDGRVPVVIAAGHTHRGVLYEVDTLYRAKPEEAELLQRFGALRASRVEKLAALQEQYSALDAGTLRSIAKSNRTENRGDG